MIDAHCHIDGADFDADRAEVLARARAAGVSPIVVVGTGPDLAHIRRAPALATREADVFATVGVHPHDAARFPANEWPELEALAADPKVRAVGEAGLDFHYDFSPREAQAESFRRQIRLATRLGKALVCHIRNAHAEALEILVAEGPPPAGVVIHCFTGEPADARAYARHSFYVSFSGITTFKSAAGIRAALAEVPKDRLLVETDSPYLAPVPLRGKRCEPAFVVHTARAVATELGLSETELARLTDENARRVFGLPGAPPVTGPGPTPAGEPHA
jgi:TatD DNase family protein